MKRAGISIVAWSSGQVLRRLRKVLRSRPPRLLRIPGFKRAASLVPLVERKGKLSLLFIVRSRHVSVHPGQVAFPGGRRKPGDAGVSGTALREAFEEVGLPPAGVQVLGRLDDVVTPSGFVIAPVVGYVRERRRYRFDRREVAAVFEADLGRLAEPCNLRDRGKRRLGGRAYRMLEYRAGRKIVWGATARAVQNLLRLIL